MVHYTPVDNNSRRKKKGRRYTDEDGMDADELPPYSQISTGHRAFVAVLLTLLTFFIVYDRLAIDGVLISLQQYFVISDSAAALIQTFAAVSSAVFFLFLGMVGDRLEKKRLLVLTIATWFVLSLVSLIIPPNMYWLYLIVRTVSALGYAVVTALGPVVVADLFEGRGRSYCLMALSVAPVLGGLVSMTLSSWFLTKGFTWKIAMLVSPVIILPLTVMLACAMPSQVNDAPIHSHRPLLSLSFFDELKCLFSIKTYTFLVAGSSLSNLYQRAMAFWMPTILLYGYQSKGAPFYFNLPFPVIMMATLLVGLVALLIGMPASMWFAESWQDGKGPFTGHPFSRSVPLFVTVTRMISAVVSAAAMTYFTRNFLLYLLFTFLNSFFTGGSTPMTTQMILDVTPRWNRAAGMAINNLIVGLADSPSALIVGALSDTFRGPATDPTSRYNAFLLALYILLGCNFFSSIFFGGATVYFPKDTAALKEDDVTSESSDSEEEPLLHGGRVRGQSIVERGLISRRATLDTAHAIAI